MGAACSSNTVSAVDEGTGKVEIYGMSISANVIPPVLFCLDNKCGEMKLMDILKGEHKSAAHLAKNPFGQMPYMVDGGVVLAESNAILRYLAKVYNPKTYGLTAAAQGNIDWAMDYVGTNFTAESYKGIWYPVAGFAAAPPDQDACNKAALEKLDAFAEKFLTGKFIGGDSLSIADYKFGPLVWYMSHPAIQKKAKWTNPPRIEKYVNDWKAAISPESQEFLKAPWGFMDTKKD